MQPGIVKIQTFPATCQGCRACEAQCSMFHYGYVNPNSVGIKIREHAELGKFDQVICVQCIDMPCAEVCPNGAIVHNSYSGAVEITEDCNGCGLCADECSIGAIRMVVMDGQTKAVKCNLCGGLPSCVPICPRQALGW